MMFIATNQYLETAKTSKVINGFVRELTIFSEFSFVIHLEEQIKAIELIPPEYRILHLDATGGLVRVNADIFKYKRILNHFAILKDSRTIGLERSQSLIVSEMVSSRQDSLQLERFFRLIRNDYGLVFPSKSLKFRSIVCDFSWAEIHASLGAFNNETVLDYSNRIFDYAKTGKTDQNKSFLLSCAAHTMHRFIRGLKKKVNLSPVKQLATYEFSLLLNCTDFESASI